MSNSFRKMPRSTSLGVALIPFGIYLVVVTVGAALAHLEGGWSINGRLRMVFLFLMAILSLACAWAATALMAPPRGWKTWLLGCGLMLLNVVLCLGSGCGACAESSGRL